MAEVLPQLAPAEQHAHLIEECERERPHHALARRARLVAVAESQLALGADRLAQQGRVDRIRRDRRAPGRSAAPRHRALRADRGGNTAAIRASALRAASRSGRIGTIGHPARSQHQRLDLLGRKHQRRQHEAGPEHIADSRLALDRRAQCLQAGHVAIEGADAYADLLASARPLTGRRWRRSACSKSKRRSERDIVRASYPHIAAGTWQQRAVVRAPPWRRPAPRP